MKKETPNHVAIIMDGSRRWAREKGLPPIEGHKRGVEAMVKTVEAAKKFGVDTLTVFALSTENYRNRSREEVQGLLTLFKEGAGKYLPRLKRNGIRVNFLGNTRELPRATQLVLSSVRSQLKVGKAGVLNIAINYGGRQEILQAIEKIKNEKKEINERNFEGYLYTSGISDPELVIRTGGRRRISNFLLWQSSYSELLFSDVLWPDFNEKELKRALAEYSARIRNFGR